MKRLIIFVIIIVCGIEFGGMAFDALLASVESDFSQLQENANKLREY